MPIWVAMTVWSTAPELGAWVRTAAVALYWRCWSRCCADQAADGDHDGEHDVPLASPENAGVVPHVLLPYYVVAGGHRHMLVGCTTTNNGHSPLGGECPWATCL